MKVDHAQIKNAIAHISERLKREKPQYEQELQLFSALRSHERWIFEIDVILPQGVQGFRKKKADYIVHLDNLETDESISLDNLFIEISGLGKAIDTAFGFIAASEKIAKAELDWIVSKDYKNDFAWSLNYWGIDNDGAEIELILLTNIHGAIIDIEIQDETVSPQ